MRPIVLLFATLLVIPLVAPLVEAQGTGPGAGGGPGARQAGERERALADAEARDWQNLSAAARERGMARAEAARLFTQLQWDEGAATSRFVSFNFTNGSLADFSVRTGDDATTYFTSVDVGGFDEGATARAAGSVVRVMGNETFFTAHANPLGLFAYRVRNAELNMTFHLAEGVNATADNERTFTLVSPAGVHGHIVVTDNATYALDADNGTATVSLGPHARLMFIHHAPRTALSATLHALRDAAAEDRLGGMLSVVGTDEGPVEDRIFLSGVTMRATQARDGRVDVLVSSENPRGRPVVVNVDRASVGLAAGADVAVLFDGQPIPMAATAAEALASSQAVAHVNQTGGELHLIVAVPRFSDHTITIEAAVDEPIASPGPTVTPTTTTTTTTSPTGTVSPSPSPDVMDDDTPAAPLVLVLAAVGALAIARRRL